MKTKKKFDCIQIKREAQKKIREAVKGMTPEEEIAFFRQGAEDFARQVQQAAKFASSKEK